MTLPSPNSESSNGAPGQLIDKNEVINVLKKLIDDYPSDMVPRHVIEDAFVKMMKEHQLKPKNSYLAFKRLEEAIAKAKSICPS